MTQQREPSRRFTGVGAQPEAEGIDFTNLKPGTKIVLNSGAVAEVVENPRDGYWVIVRYISSAEEPQLAGTVEPIMCYDVAGLA
ncbi:MAG TPA: hypothetical protein VNL15_07215 [Dehalococcoidia bacterium]|nr:hypothetical protein [Dehalococcoidia bacterium]